MCLTLFTHHCLAVHETRPLCTINPATDCTVLNPYAEPWRNPCPNPCIEVVNVSANPGHACPWHGDCCRLVRASMCGAFDPGHCPNDVPYHQRREPTVGMVVEEADDLTQEVQFPPLPVFNEEPWFVALRWDYFQAATDLYNVGARRTSYAAAMKQARDMMLPPFCTTKMNNKRDVSQAPRRKKVTGVDRRYLNAGRKHSTMALYLGQLAQVWDLNASYGLCPPRPGRNPHPSLAWPGDAQVDPERGVWSIGYELAWNVKDSVVWPPAHQQLFETHHLPHRVGIPMGACSSSPPGAWNGNMVKAKPEDDDDVDMATIAPAMTSIYPEPPSPPPASYAVPSFSFASFATPSLFTPSLCLDNNASQVSLERSLAAEDASITRNIRESGKPRELFGRYFRHSHDNGNHSKIPNDMGMRQWDPVMRDRVAAARDEVLLSPQSTTMLLLPGSEAMEMQRVGIKADGE
ncbi:hypothetical protein PG996_012521 [Apiospora saccharicola]|uniref:Uncharacterized protein n=1 Tax=Apiospora saccharicola TaxID=335842 RepID=A0ABR1U2U1_9PEZI